MFNVMMIAREMCQGLDNTGYCIQFQTFNMPLNRKKWPYSVLSYTHPLILATMENPGSTGPTLETAPRAALDKVSRWGSLA